MHNWILQNSSNEFSNLNRWSRKGDLLDDMTQRMENSCCQVTFDAFEVQISFYRVEISRLIDGQALVDRNDLVPLVIQHLTVAELVFLFHHLESTQNRCQRQLPPVCRTGNTPRSLVYSWLQYLVMNKRWSWNSFISWLLSILLMCSTAATAQFTDKTKS